MNVGLVIGKKNSTGVPGKNIRPIVGRPAAEYAFLAAKHAGLDETFVSTDCPVIAGIGRSYGASHIERPAILATPEALTEDALMHAYECIKSSVSKPISTISLLFCNNPAIDVPKLKEAVRFVTSQDEYDSCFSVAKYDMFTPARARQLTSEGEILPFVRLEHIPNVSSIRNSSGSSYFCDLSIQVMKPRCFDDMDAGQLPFKWQGKRSKAVEIDFGFDIDAEWQFIVVEYWLKSRGFTETRVPW
jgi:CMP-N-acetylneuraminic acid synthetase